MRTRKRQLAVVFFLILAAQGCNTIRGLGEDIAGLSRGVQDAMTENQ